MYPCIINGRSCLLDRFQHQMPAVDLILWLESSPFYPKVFWKERDSQVTRAAVGSLIRLSSVPHFSEPCPFEMRLYGGGRFSAGARKDQTWQDFPDTSFWLPQIEISQEGDQAQVVIYSLNGPVSVDLLLSFTKLNAMPTHSYTLIERREIPSYNQWQESVEKVLELISSGHIDKLVLGRKTTLKFTSPLSAWPILCHLNAKAKHATLFAFQLSARHCFLGATPEKLFEREGCHINTDAIASTRPRGKSTEEDILYEKELLTNPKEQKEFEIVKDYLDAALSTLSDQMQWENSDCVLKTWHVQHLYNRISGRLKNAISDADLIRFLHPTPALGGYPRKQALDYLDKIEPFERGWYGAPVGVIGQSGARLYVAIRSALIQEHFLHLFAGTGLVEGSIAKQEWEELEQKVRPFTELFF
jgi:menaquinone-specific isochorismate synthase